MMKKYCFHVLSAVSFLAILFASLAGKAQTPVTLQQAVDLAYSHSPQILKARSSAEEASWKRVEAQATYLPTLTGSVNYLADKRYMLTDVTLPSSPAPITIPQIVPTTIYSLTAQYNLFDGLASTNRFLSARKFESAGQKESDWARFRVAREIQLQFYKVLASKTLKEVASANVKVLEDHLKDVGNFRKAGISTNYDVLRVEVQVSEARSELMNAEDNVLIGEGRLGEALGEEAAFDPQGDLPVPKPEMIAKLDDRDVESRPDLAAMALKTEGMDDLATAASRHWVPRVSLFGTYQFYNNRTNETFNNEDFREAYQVGVALTWNFFDGFSQMAKSGQALEQKRQTDLSLRQARLKAKQDVDLWKRKFQYNCAVFRSRQSDVEKASESVRLAKEGRRVGARTETDLLDAEAELHRAKAGAVNAQIGALEALINLELATGRNLSQL